MSDQVVHPQIEMRKISSCEIVDGIRPHCDRCIPQQCVASALEINEVPAPDLLKMEIDATSHDNEPTHKVPSCATIFGSKIGCVYQPFTLFNRSVNHGLLFIS